jgi:hypothetical protein
LNLLLQAAQEYLRLGYHPIPCAPREKRPLVAWKDFQTTMPTSEQLTTWWSRTPDANVALVLGRGRFAVDLDGGDAAETLLAEAGIGLPEDAPRSRTGGGYHVFLSCRTPIPDRVGLLATNGTKPQVDIRGVGIVVAPPSIHPNGATYEWMTPLVELPPYAPLALTDLIHKSPGAPVTAAREPHAAGNRFWVADALRGVGEGLRDQMCTRLAGYFLTKGIDEETTIALLAESFARACDPPFPVRDVEKCVRSIARRQVAQDDAPRGIVPQHVSTVLDAFSESLAAGPAPTLATPFPTLNHYLNGGFGPGELIYLGARPGVGKTALGLELARFAAKKQTGAVLVISREMTNLALARRLVAQDARIRASAIKRASLNDTERWSLAESLERMKRLPLFFTDEVVSLGEITTLIDETAAEAPLALVVVDYLQLIRAPKDIKDRRHQVEAVSQGLKTLALHHKVPILCLSSLSRASTDEKNKPPTLASLRESGELEHDADVILLLHRSYHEQDTACIVAKNRDGRLGNVSMLFRSDFVAFDEASEARYALDGMDA